MTNFFTVQKKDKNSRARAGVIHTAHGDLQTPCLMTVGTKATVKPLTPGDLKKIGVGCVLCNTYHLHLNPGEDLVARAGGLHKFMNWDGPMFTDSGGFQVFSMGHGTVSDEIKSRERRHSKSRVLEISESGVRFRSYLDGAEKILSPEISIQIQNKLGADMIAAFDECTPFHVDKNYTRNSMEMTHRWLDRCIFEHENLKSPTKLFGIIQGGIYPDLREIATDFVEKSNTPGICIGGSLGQNKSQMYDVVEMVMARISPEKPVHLLGIGDLDDLVRGVERGIDTFDCVTPTRNARHGLLFSSEFPDKKLRITNSEFRENFSPIDKNCDCEVCQNFTRAYVNYLFRANEYLGIRLATHHNVHFIQNFVRKMRESILTDQFEKFKTEWGF
ncbi:tRNA guanosine(34) transglycosylase Tgt [bacterium]|nr:tRNA guanosine(34) transglycosylase Tgt [bacterium]